MKWGKKSEGVKTDQPYAFRTTVGEEIDVSLWCDDLDDSHPLTLVIQFKSSGIEQQTSTAEMVQDAADAVFNMYTTIKRRELGLDGAKDRIFDVLDRLAEAPPEYNPDEEPF